MESQPPSDTLSTNPKAQTTDTAPSPHPPPLTKRNTKCKCQCDPQCKCNCSCLAHCICARKHDHDQECKLGTTECKHVCGKTCTSSRNLVVCLDGTTNQFGHWNTNVVELHNRILKESEDANQLTFYSSGIGTRVPSTTHRLSTWYYNTIDSAIARSFMAIIEKAYQWLADHYRDGDRIFLFGFSRGAYQVRALAGMIRKLGLVFSGNIGLIPFAYELYANRYRGKGIKDEADARALAENFKRTFSRKVKVHFVGVWDTVASVGLIQKSPLPLTTTAYHICTFRHGLALDERRVKFLPTYLAGGWTPNLQLDEYYNPDDKLTDVKEVWFVGSHSDVGGSNDPRTLSLGLVPLLWMENQAIDAGLRFRPRSFFGDWTWENLHKSKPTTSLRSFWRLLEVLPITRYQYTDRNATTRMPHFGRGRSIVPRQRIHVSVAFSRKNYKSKARFSGDKTMDLESIINIGINSDSDEAGDLSWADGWKHVFEMDLFDDAFVQEMIKQLHSPALTEYRRSGNNNTGLDTIAVNEWVRLLRRLSIMALSYRSAKKILSKVGYIVKMLKGQNPRIQAASASCLFQLANHGFSQQIISEEDALPELERMLKTRDDSDLKIASLQCLLQLGSKPRDEDTQQGTDYSRRVAEILMNEHTWPEFLYDHLVDSHSNDPIQRAGLAGLSCLMRLAKSDTMKQQFIAWIDMPKSARWSNLVSTLLGYLQHPRTGFHAALTLRNMSTEVIKWQSTQDSTTQKIQRSTLFNSLMLGIRNGNPTAKGTYMRCLSKYFEKDKDFRKIALQATNFITTLVTELFGTETHCSISQKKHVKRAFLMIMRYRLVGGGTENIREVIRKIIEAICIEFWLDERDGSELLLGIFEFYKDSSSPRRPDKTQVSKMIITEMVHLTLSTRQRFNGMQSDLDHTLYRVQAFLNKIYDAGVFKEPSPDVIGTIITAMKNRTSRVKAVEFLESLAKKEKGLHFMPLLTDITELGRKMMKNDKGTVLVIFHRVGARNNGEGARPLANVRDALRVLVHHDCLRKYILEPKNFEIIKKAIDFQDIIHTRRGDRVQAEIARVKCLQKLIVYPEACKMMNSDLIRPLLDVYQAFNEELGSSQWLNMWPEYGKLLEATLKKFKENVDKKHLLSLDNDLQERLERFFQ